MSEHRIVIATDFTKYPGPRYSQDGPYSGEQFRNEILLPALRTAADNNAELHVILDGVAGYGSSFLEEAFGGMIRAGISPQTLERHLRIVADTSRFQHHRVRALAYIKEQASRLQAA